MTYSRLVVIEEFRAIEERVRTLRQRLEEEERHDAFKEMAQLRVIQDKEVMHT